MQMRLFLYDSLTFSYLHIEKPGQIPKNCWSVLQKKNGKLNKKEKQPHEDRSNLF